MSNGIYSARVAVMQYYQQKNIKNVKVEDVFIGNGVSELIVMAMQGLVNNDDEVLITQVVVETAVVRARLGSA